MTATSQPTYTRRYQAWLAAGQPDMYPLWVQARWREFFERVEGCKPGSNVRISLGIAINTAIEDMRWFVLHHQDAFDNWLEAGALPA